MSNYTCVDGDVLDAICWRFYGRVDVLWQVLEANPGLAELGAVYPTGLVIKLPEVGQPVKSTVRLWD